MRNRSIFKAFLFPSSNPLKKSQGTVNRKICSSDLIIHLGLQSLEDRDFHSSRLFVKTTNPQRNTHPQKKTYVCLCSRKKEEAETSKEESWNKYKRCKMYLNN